MATIKDMLHEEYLKNDSRPKGSMKINNLKEEKNASLTPVKRKRGLGDVFVALQSQRVFNPNIPSVPSPQPAPANTFQKGVTPALDSSGAWGGAAQTGEK